VVSFEWERGNAAFISPRRKLLNLGFFEKTGPHETGRGRENQPHPAERVENRVWVDGGPNKGEAPLFKSKPLKFYRPAQKKIEGEGFVRTGGVANTSHRCGKKSGEKQGAGLLRNTSF